MHAFQGQDTMQPWKGSLGEQQSKSNIAVAFGKGVWNPTQPNGGVDFGEGCALECGIQLNGAVDFWAKTLWDPT